MEPNGHCQVIQSSIKHSKHKSNPEKFNGKRSIKTVRNFGDTMGEVSNLLSDKTSYTFSPSYVIFVNKAALSDPNWTNSSPILKIYHTKSALQSFGH